MATNIGPFMADPLLAFVMNKDKDKKEKDAAAKPAKDGKANKKDVFAKNDKQNKDGVNQLVDLNPLPAPPAPPVPAQAIQQVNTAIANAVPVIAQPEPPAPPEPNPAVENAVAVNNNENNTTNNTQNTTNTANGQQADGNLPELPFIRNALANGSVIDLNKPGGQSFTTADIDSMADKALSNLDNEYINGRISKNDYNDKVKNIQKRRRFMKFMLQNDGMDGKVDGKVDLTQMTEGQRKNLFDNDEFGDALKSSFKRFQKDQETKGNTGPVANAGNINTPDPNVTANPDPTAVNQPVVNAPAVTATDGTQPVVTAQANNAAPVAVNNVQPMVFNNIQANINPPITQAPANNMFTTGTAATGFNSDPTLNTLLNATPALTANVSQLSDPGFNILQNPLLDPTVNSVLSFQ